MTDEAARTVQPLCEPFILRDYATRVLPALGRTAEETTVQPLLIAAQHGDGSYQVTEKLGRKCVQTDVKSGRRFIYFCLPPDSPLRNIDQTVWITIDYCADWTTGCSFWVEYVSSNPAAPMGGNYTASESIRVPDSAAWRRKTIALPQAMLNGKQNFNADFRICCGENCDVAIADIRLSPVETRR